MSEAELAPPSPLFEAHREALRAAAALGPVLDLACGRGRHALATARLGHFSVGLDRDAESLAELKRRADAGPLPLCAVRADLETGIGIPVRSESCGAILVFRFLFRPLAAEIVRCLQPGGLLLYETFHRRQPELGWGPRRRSFLLEDGELPALFPTLEILQQSEGLHEDAGRPEYVARLAAQRPA